MFRGTGTGNRRSVVVGLRKTDNGDWQTGVRCARRGNKKDKPREGLEIQMEMGRNI